jgi:hypothetical protein
MQTFFLYYVDLAALILSFALAIFHTISSTKTSILKIRPVAVFFMLFGPCAIIVHMSAHVIEISYNAIVNMVSGRFVYNFRFYSLMLMGVVVIGCSVYFLELVKKYYNSKMSSRRLFKAALAITFLTAPTIPFTPIGSLPAMACIISLSALPFVRKKKQIVSAITV